MTGGGPPAPLPGRRSTLLAAAAAALWPADALGQARGREVVLAPPLPCTGRQGDIVSLLLEGTGAAEGTIVVFGQAFRAGDLPRGATLSARLASGRALAIQADVTTRHADGSARFAIVSLAAPALRTGERAGIILARDGGGAQAPLSASAGRSAVVEVAPVDGGAPWRVDLAPALAAPGGQRPPWHGGFWQAGPLAVQARVRVPVPPAAVGGATSARLVADVALRADGTLWCDAWVRNDIAMRPGGGVARYVLRVLLDGRLVLQSPPLTQHQYTGIGREVAARPGGAPAPAPPLVRHDVAYLAEAGAIARYDLSVGVDQRLLTAMGALLARPDWVEPFNPRGLMQAMGAGGDRGDIGPTTVWQAAWLISGDPRAAAVALGQAEADGAIPWHFWDAAGGADRQGGWMDVDRWPGFWSDPRGGPPPRTLLQPMPIAETGWQPNRSHQPDLSFVPYLLTGRRAFLDGLLAQVTWSIMSWGPARSGPETHAAHPPVRNINLASGAQVRSVAWTLRTIGNAAWIAPDDDPAGQHARRIVAANLGWMRAMIPAWTELQGEAHGWLPGVYTSGALPPWQQDFLVSTIAAEARRGSADARAVLGWMANFIVGRFLAQDRGFPPRDGVAYLIAHAPGERPWLPPYRSWGEIGAATRERGWSNGDGWRHSNGYYGRLGLQSLAAMIDVLGLAAARRAYAWLVEASPPFTRPDDLANAPTLAIVPRDMPRVPARAARCLAAS
jgi:hypothetical protein